MNRTLRIAFTCSLALTLLRNSSAQDASGELAAVLKRASEYVGRYEGEQLGNLLVSEEYLQSSAEYSPVQPNPGQNLVESRNKRRIESDFLILQIGTDRRGVRLVNKVDGIRVKTAAGSLEAIEKGSPDENKRMIDAINRENVRYDIGSVLRHTNVPTFALRVVQAGNLGRFDFTRSGADKIKGIVTWTVKFVEKRTPTLLVDLGPTPRALFSSGFLWIEPATGRVLKTEFSVENPYSKPRAKGLMVVTYEEDKSLGIYVPKQMVEHYESERGFVDCQAFYSNFRSFGVKVTSEILQTP